MANGPGKLSRILGVCMEHNGILLNESKIWIYESKSQTPLEILTSSRIGVDYAGEDALLPYRVYLKHYKPVK